MCVQTHRPLLLIVVNQATSLALGPPGAVTTAVWKPYVPQHLPRSSEAIKPAGIFRKGLWFTALQLGFLIVVCRGEGQGQAVLGKSGHPKADHSQILRNYWSASLPKLVSSRFSQRPFLKKKV